MGFDPSIPYGNMGPDVGFIKGFMIVYLVFFMVMSVYGLLAYILQSLGMYTIAQRRGIHHPWLAWIPVGADWILGSISDQYMYVSKGRVTNRRKVLLIFNIIIIVMALALMVISFIMTFEAVSSVMGAQSTDMMMTYAIVGAVISLVMLVLALILLVFQYVSLYDLYVSCNPNSAAAFLVLCIFFPFLLPFFVFADRNKDLGMPPRRPQPETYQIPVTTEPAPVCEQAPQQEESQE